ncbi:unnamed protein product [Allacma fusca]|uniref:Uncharacterized protein n=1 Tax=Allacma fusca TaxID=39272 RepID=A0A8J2KBN1_9HEXA|nr:unnamed protein product [Allacma fusca]
MCMQKRCITGASKRMWLYKFYLFNTTGESGELKRAAYSHQHRSHGGETGYQVPEMTREDFELYQELQLSRSLVQQYQGDFMQP